MKNSVVIIIAIAFLVISFFVFTGTPLFIRGYSVAKTGLGEISGPLLRVAGKPADGIRYVFQNYVNLVGTKKENADLQKKLDALLLEHQRLSDLEQENKRLKAILNLMEQRPKTMVAARVVGEDVKNWFRCLIVDKGRTSGLAPKMPVITPKGLVGQVVECDRWVTKVMVISDTNSSVDVYIEGRNSRGILEGTGQNPLKLKYIRKNDEIEVGDKLITSGMDGIYPKGLATGIVTTINRNKPGIFAEVEVIPFNNFTRLEEVLIVKK
ncbi:MAG TPA: rod shape-determining protein MreC [Syntrophorhabdus aromaticivorans]|nr:rod shape-determining protein MreC [Syntrophorhabdus aromaticivorans]